jgi:hypothetical protein
VILKCFTGKDKKFHRIFGDEVQVSSAPQPSDIIWENYGISNTKTFFRKCVAICALILLSLIVYSVIFIFIIKGTDFTKDFPSSVPCQDVKSSSAA